MAFFRKPVQPVLRPLRSERAEQCAALHAACFAHSWSAPEFETLLSNAAVSGEAAVDPKTDDLRGFILTRLAADEAEILTIAVDGAFRRRGVGRSLLSSHMSRLPSAGARALFLEVERDNAAAIALYARFGFREVGQRPGYYRKRDGSAAAALILRRDLI
ncbi:MAG TPA: ribosomal protein S18-alanine N-acetyltransferase [Roseiarcus sp.]|nr:ribosomal protein S18-alanine N-acetyltransferase [Roseiarcus sp.]